MQPSTSPLAPALQAFATQPQVVEATEALREASAGLRWHEALRRRWREARAEAAVRDAVASASLEGAVVARAALREAVAGGNLARPGTGDPSLDVAAGLWRSGVRLNSWMADLRGPTRPTPPAPPALLASLHRDLTGPLAASGRLPLEEVGVLRASGQPAREAAPGGSSAADPQRVAGILVLMEEPGLPALVRAAVVHGEVACAQPFTAANAALGRLLVRHLITRDGLEPTGVAVLSLYPARAPQAYAQALAGYASGTAAGVTAWILWQAEAILAGIEEATALCRSIQAGTTAFEN